MGVKDFEFQGKPILPTVIVKDGTKSSRQDRLIYTQEADAEKRRAYQDKQARASDQGIGEDGSVARLGSNRMVTQDSPRLVLWYRKQEVECVSEITMIPVEGRAHELEPMFTLVCYRCIERKVPQGQAQLQIRNSHRKFSIDDTKRGPRKVHVGGGQTMIVMEHGKVTVEDIVRCSNVGCGWTVRIIDSRVEEI